MNADLDAAATLAAIDADLTAIDAALHRLDAGTYGTCDRCGTKLADSVLEHDPFANACLPACA